MLHILCNCVHVFLVCEINKVLLSDVDGPEVDEISSREDLEFKISEDIDGCTQKRLVSV